MVGHKRDKDEGGVSGWEKGKQLHRWFLESEGHPLGQSRQDGGDSELPSQVGKEEKGMLKPLGGWPSPETHLRAGTERISPLGCGEAPRKIGPRDFLDKEPPAGLTPRADNRNSQSLVGEGGWAELGPGRYQGKGPVPWPENNAINRSCWISRGSLVARGREGEKLRDRA